MSTEVSKYLKRMRSERSENLATMASNLGISPAMLASIESGRRNAPKDFIDRMKDQYSLDTDELDELTFALQTDAGAYPIHPDGLSEEDRYLAFKLAQAFPLLSRETKNLFETEIRKLESSAKGASKIIQMRDGRELLVPCETKVINPSDAQRCDQLYIIWFFRTDKPVTLKQAWNGEHVGPLYVYASNRTDLYKPGNLSPLFASSEDRKACKAEFAILAKLMLKEATNVYRTLEEDALLQYSWANIDETLCEDPRVGTSAIVSKL